MKSEHADKDYNNEATTNNSLLNTFHQAIIQIRETEGIIKMKPERVSE